MLRAHWVDSPGSLHGAPGGKGPHANGGNKNVHVLPSSECFSFALNTLLTDIAARDAPSSPQVTERGYAKCTGLQYTEIFLSKAREEWEGEVNGNEEDEELVGLVEEKKKTTKTMTKMRMMPGG